MTTPVETANVRGRISRHDAVGPERVLVVACGMLGREVVAIASQPGMNHVDVQCLPAIFHHHPERIGPALEIAVQKARLQGYQHILVGYGDCGSGGEVDKVCSKFGVERIAGPHCFAFYQGNDKFEQLGDDDICTFYITDFLARQFDAFLKKPLGLDRYPELLEMYFGNYKRAVYLAQTQDEELEKLAREAANFLGLEFECRFTGYGELALDMNAMAERARAS